MKHRNYALLVDENSHYPVSYTFKPNGDKVIESTMLKGLEMTENQIKELFFLGYFEEKPTQEEVDEYLDWLNEKKTIVLQIGMKVKIKNDTNKYLFDSGKEKTITSDLPNFGKERAFGLDGDDGIWCIADFEYCVNYPDFIMR